MSNFQIDYNSMLRFQKTLEKLEQKEIDEILQTMASIIAKKLLREITNNTPVKTGTLKKGWTGESKQNVAYYVSQLPIIKEKDTYIIELLNPVYYGIFVEYGHHTRSGSWVKGKYFLRLSIHNLQQTQEPILSSYLFRKLKEVFLK